MGSGLWEQTLCFHSSCSVHRRTNSRRKTSKILCRYLQSLITAPFRIFSNIRSTPSRLISSHPIHTYMPVYLVGWYNRFSHLPLPSSIIPSISPPNFICVTCQYQYYNHFPHHAYPKSQSQGRKLACRGGIIHYIPVGDPTNQNFQIQSIQFNIQSQSQAPR